MIQLDFHRAHGEVSGVELATLRAEFALCGGTRVAGLLSPAVLEYLANTSDPAAFEARDLGPLGVQLRGTSPTEETAVTLALNRLPLLQLLEQISSRAPIKSIVGHIARLTPGTNQQLTWHDDENERDRVLGLSVHLGQHPYEGGRFQLRRKSDGRVLWDIANTGTGDMIAFSIAPEYEHRVTPVDGTIPRTVFAGWAMASRPPLSPDRVAAGA